MGYIPELLLGQLVHYTNKAQWRPVSSHGCIMYGGFTPAVRHANIYRDDRSFPACTSRLSLSYGVFGDGGCRRCTKGYYQPLNFESKVIPRRLSMQ